MTSLFSAYTAANATIPKVLLSDVPFLHTPSRIALACLLYGKLNPSLLKEYLIARFDDLGEDELLKEKGKDQIETMLAELDIICNEIKSVSTIDKDLAKILVVAVF